jgi:hypothetical protein
MQARLPSFWIKVALTVAVVAAADVLLFDVDGLGLNLGLFSLALAAALGLANPAIRRHRLALLALLAAALFAVLQIERATFVGWALFAVAMAVAALAPRAPRGQDGWRWFQRLIVGGFKALIGPLLDLRDVLKIRARSGPMKVRMVLAGFALPILGGVVFIGLFAAANPVIEEALGGIHVPEADFARAIFWALVTLILWAVLRPRGLRRTLRTPGLDGDLKLPGVTATSIAASLALFNVIFAVQNGLDITYLWSGAGLPKGVSFSEYAHRGAEPLIATALLAGLFVLVFLRPGSATAASRPIRILVTVWVAQNLFLVASTALRTIDYIEAYSLTRMRIAALIWMALVAVGLVLLTWRLLRGKTSSWLINANLVALGAGLATCSFVDLGAVAARWNVRHAAEVDGQGAALDLCYLRSLKGAAVLPLVELERRPLPTDLHDRIAYVRRDLTADLARNQGDWRGWRWRDARRLDGVVALTGEQPVRPLNEGRSCDGAKPIPRPAPAAAPLTPSPKPGT